MSSPLSPIPQMALTTLEEPKPASPEMMSVDEPAEARGPINPVPMSFPAFLRNAGLADRYAHLHDETHRTVKATGDQKKKRSRDNNEGKRWIRRKDNARFVGNAHIIAPGFQDMSVNTTTTRSTFPEPLPSYLSRSTPAPSAQAPLRDPQSASAGHFSMSLKGMRRMLRAHGPRAQQTVADVESELIGWLSGVGGGIGLPDEPDDVLIIRGRPIGNSLTIMEMSRTPLQLVWCIEQDAFARYIVHCCCRYHNVVSFSKDVDGRRLTYLLRPNVTRQDYAARNILDTPPATESDASLGVLSEPDIFSDISDTQSDAGLSRLAARHRRLSSVSERGSNAASDDERDFVLVEADSSEALDATEGWTEATPQSRRTTTLTREGVDNLTDDADDDSSVNGDLAQSVDSLDLVHDPPLRYSTAPVTQERTPLRDMRAISRTPSSPSRSPCPPSRRPLRGSRKRVTAARRAQGKPQSFYDFLYA